MRVQCYVCLLTFSVACCKHFAAILFIFAKCAAPFRGKNPTLHRSGATDDRFWCDQVAQAARTGLPCLTKQ
ncbi:hypothetical protein EL09_09540 [Salmonella enterica subsp. enterica]|nr:hypothetical protein [Salmonella enterica subsp. enterica]